MPSRTDREALIAALEAAREGTAVVAYVTSTRTNLETQMAMDQTRVIYRHLAELAAGGRIPRLDLFIHSNGGDGTVPWRLVNIIREHADEFNLLVPFHAFSAATLTALGADHVIVGPMGMLGPIDPTITTPYNPVNPENPTQRLGISVEDVSSYFALVRDDVGIRHEDELVQAFKLLAEKVHPLALGTVKRSTSQSRMLGEKLLRQRRAAPEMDDHSITELVDKLASKLYYHGHPISRREAVSEVKLPFVEDAAPQVEHAMWALYEAFEEDMQLERPFNPVLEATAGVPMAVPPPPQMGGPGQLGGTTIEVRSAHLGPYALAWVQSRVRSDHHLTEFDVVLTRDWMGETQAKLAVGRSEWSREA